MSMLTLEVLPLMADLLACSLCINTLRPGVCVCVWGGGGGVRFAIMYSYIILVLPPPNAVGMELTGDAENCSRLCFCCFKFYEG